MIEKQKKKPKSDLKQDRAEKIKVLTINKKWTAKATGKGKMTGKRKGKQNSTKKTRSCILSVLGRRIRGFIHRRQVAMSFVL